MAKAFIINEFELKPGVTEEDFENFLKEESTLGYFSDLHSIGWYPHIVKGVRGDRDGKYLLLTEIESVETRDRYYPDDGEVTEDIEEWYANHPNIGIFWEKMKNLTNFESVASAYYVE